MCNFYILSLLPETIVTALQYTPFVARYREILADELVQNADSINQTGKYVICMSCNDKAKDLLVILKYWKPR